MNIPPPFEGVYYIILLLMVVGAPAHYWWNYARHYRYVSFWPISVVRGGAHALLLALGAIFGALAAQVIAPLPPGTPFGSGSGFLLIFLTGLFGYLGIRLAGICFRIPVWVMLDAHDANFLKLSFDETEQLLLISAVAEKEGIDLRKGAPVPATYRTLTLEARYALLRDLVTRQRRGLWIAIPRTLARRHEAYFRNPAIILFLGAFVAQFVIGTVVDFSRLLGYGNLASMIGLLQFFVLGAIAVPSDAYLAFTTANPWFVPLSGPLFLFISQAIVLLVMPWNPLRYAGALAIAAYVALSIALIPYAVAEWREHAFVQLYLDAKEWARMPLVSWIAARLQEAYVSDTLLGLIGAYNQIAPYLPSALLGFSAMLWLPIAARLVSHLLISESANLFYASRVRAPLVFYSDPQSSEPAPLAVPAQPAEVAVVKDYSDAA